ncbi:hypothetical protein [Qipengyuania sp. ASV99]|uniref:hypothetical protein n=1 Tax=Qipengyuania sp. ASV99 TaxID=3399681 RepID=UPI003A4C80BD
MASTLLSASARASRANRARVLAGAAALVFAVTIPDLSAGAMDSPYLRIDVREPAPILQQSIWSPAAKPTGPVYVSTMAAEQIAPSSLTYGSRTRFAGMERTAPLGFLETGSERFDLAFAGVAMPTPPAFTISRGLPEQPAAAIQAFTPALRARQVDIQQITSLSGIARVPGPAQSRARAASAEVRVQRARPALEAGSSSLRSLIAANESVAAAFAGTLDVSGDLRGAIPLVLVPVPTAPIRQQQRANEPARSPRPSPVPAPESERAAIAVPTSARRASVSASSEAQAVLNAKTHLDARVNGVLAGRVDFRQLDGTIAVRLGSLVDLLQERFSASELDRLASAGGLGSYITLAQLQAAGIPISYDPVYDEVALGIDYDDAPQAGKVQVEQIGAPTMGSDRTLIDQIPR